MLNKHPQDMVYFLEGLLEVHLVTGRCMKVTVLDLTKWVLMSMKILAGTASQITLIMTCQRVKVIAALTQVIFLKGHKVRQ